MKLSVLSDEEISKLSYKEITDIIYGGVSKEVIACDYGIILGGKPQVCTFRAQKGAELYKSGKVGKLICTGGVKWDTADGQLYESEILKKLLLENGVPSCDIIVERQSKTTKENMIFATLRIMREYNPDCEKSAIIITSSSHLKRSLALAERLLPSQMKICGASPDNTPDSPDTWMNSPFIRERVMRELSLYREFILTGWMDEVEF